MPSVWNQSTVATDEEVKRWVAACDYQMRNHFVSSHELSNSWRLTFEDPGKYINIRIVDTDVDVEGALAYHDYDGRPIGVVLAETCLQYGVEPSSALSHEYLEIRRDAYCNELAQDGQRAYWYEVCDAVQNYAYPINGVQVSNFCTKRWFQRGAEGPYDFMFVLTEPFQVRHGYQVYLDASGGTQVVGERVPYHGWRGLSRV